MRKRVWFGVAALLALIAVGCNGTVCATGANCRPLQSEDDLARPAPCTGAIADFCGPHLCPDYDEELAIQEARVGLSGCYLSRVGTCGALRFIESSSSPTGSIVRYYDDATRLVSAVTVIGDTPLYCGGTSSSIHYGPAITCTLVETKVLCP